MSNSVTTTIAVVGQDRASEVINKVRKSLQETGEAAGGAAEKTGDIAEKSGDLERGFKGLKDILGDTLSGPLAGIADKFGGIEAILKGFGGAVGPLALGLAVAGSAAAYLYQQAEAARKAALDRAIEEINVAKASEELLARRYFAHVETLGVIKEINTAQEAQAAVKAQLALVAQAEIKVKEAEKEADIKGIIAAQQKLSIARDLAAEGAKRVKDLQDSEERDKTRQARAINYQVELLEKDRQIANMTDVKARRTEQNNALQAELVRLEERQATLKKSSAAEGEKGLAYAKELLEVTKKLFDVQDKQKADLKAQDAEDKARRDKQIADGEKYRAKLEEIRKARASAESDILTAKAAQETDPRLKQQAEFAAATQRYEAERFEIERKYARDKITLRLMLEALDQKALATEGQRLAQERQLAEAAKTANANAQAEAMARMRAAAIEVEDNPAAKRKLQLIDIEKQKLREVEAIKANTALNDRTRTLQISAVQATAHSREIALIRAEDAARQQESASRLQGVIQVAGAIASALEQEGANRRVIAAIRAGMEAAEVYASIGNVPAMISHGIAAALYAKVALTSTPTAGGGQSAAATPEQVSGTAMSGAQTGGGGTVNVVLSRGFVIGTPAQVGKAVNGALGSLKGTGFAGKGV